MVKRMCIPPRIGIAFHSKKTSALEFKYWIEIPAAQQKKGGGGGGGGRGMLAHLVALVLIKK